MYAKVGDELIVDTPHTGDPQRRCEILEVLGEGAVVHYRVRWDDGYEALYFPGSDADVAPLGQSPS